ncbi:MAG: hypothetical protein IK051_00885 [Rhodocyclaceae bacterium]|nr:hypothetical protein [Rhodocyclaceae bacterium]MBR4877820.1 hypothetical protein [Rhodocyclaceae bacterium]
MSAMTEYAKNVFNDKALLRDKLKIFLHTTDTAKIESYAQACEKFFASGGKQQLGFSATWSWPACIATGFFFLYRKDYLSTVIAFIVSLLASALGWILCGICGKYFIAKKFVSLLNTEDDSELQINGGTHGWVIPVAIVVYILGTIAVIAAMPME